VWARDKEYRISDYEVVNHGCYRSETFGGCDDEGYENVITYSDDNALGAYICCLSELSEFENDIPREHELIKNDQVLPETVNDCWWYVSIRYNLEPVLNKAA
jgi:hypothetical protein